MDGRPQRSRVGKRRKMPCTIVICIPGQFNPILPCLYFSNIFVAYGNKCYKKKTDRQNDKKTERRKDRKTTRHKNRKTKRQKDRKTKRQKDKRRRRQMKQKPQ